MTKPFNVYITRAIVKLVKKLYVLDSLKIGYLNIYIKNFRCIYKECNYSSFKN